MMSDYAQMDTDAVLRARIEALREAYSARRDSLPEVGKECTQAIAEAIIDAGYTAEPLSDKPVVRGEPARAKDNPDARVYVYFEQYGGMVPLPAYLSHELLVAMEGASEC